MFKGIIEKAKQIHQKQRTDDEILVSKILILTSLFSSTYIPIDDEFVFNGYGSDEEPVQLLIKYKNDQGKFDASSLEKGKPTFPTSTSCFYFWQPKTD